MDNRMVVVTSEGDDALALALRLVWSNAPGSKATHYKIVKIATERKEYGDPVMHAYSRMLESDTGTLTLILLWHEEQGATPLPFPLHLEEAISFVQGWLKSADYGRQPDHDGSNGKGWHIFTDSWGHVAGHHYAIVGIQPAWAMYGK